MKRIGLKNVLAVALLLVCSTSMAQYEKTENYRQRLGHGRDSVAAEKFYVDYVKGFRKAWDTEKVEDWQACYRPLKELLVLAPYATYNLTNTGGGARVITELIKTEQDTVQRYVYFKDLMAIDNFRINHREALNSIPKDGGEARIPLTQGSVLLWKAHHYHTVGMPSIPERVYRRDSAYQYFVKAFDQIKKENVGTENEIEPNYLAEYFETCRDLYLSDKEKYTEQFMTDYTQCLESCDKMMTVYGNGVDSVRWGYYAGVRNNIQVYFGQTGVGSAENLKNYYSQRIDSVKDNYPVLKNAIHLMLTNDSMLTEPIFYKACRYSYKLQPDFENCIGMAQEAKTQFEDNETALKYFNEADQMATNPKEHYLANAQVGFALAGEPRPSEETMLDWANMSTADRNDQIRAWQARQVVAAEKLNDALAYAKEAAMDGQYMAPVYYAMAQSYRRAESESSLNLAEQCLAMAVRAYPAFGEGNNKIELEQENINRAKSTIEGQKVREREYARNKAQYDAYMRRQAEIAAKQKAEQDFWKRK